MGNCLVTKLKASIDNPNLPKLGEMTFKVLAGKKRRFSIGVSSLAAQSVNFSVINGLFKTTSDAAQGVTSVDVAPDNVFSYWIEASADYDAIVTISDKYVIKSFGTGPMEGDENAYVVNLNDLAYSPYLTSLAPMQSIYATGNLRTILSSKAGQGSMSLIDCWRSSVEGTTADIADNLAGLGRLSCTTSGVTGDILPLAKFTNIYDITGNGLSGTIEAFAPVFLQNLAAAGITEHTLRIKSERGQITYQGNRYNDGDLVISNGSWTFNVKQP